jgi:hypothetical protein
MVPCLPLVQRRKLNSMDAHSKKLRGRISRGIGALTVSGGLVLAVAVGAAWGQTRVESLERPDGQRVSGHLAGDSRTGFGFTPMQSPAPLALEIGSIIHFNGSGPASLVSPPPFRVLIGESLRLSGSLRGITLTGVRLGLFWQAPDVTMPRPGVQAVVQRPGESRVLVDGFETLDATRWSITGKPEVVALPHLADKHSLRLPAGGTSLVHTLGEPMASGRFDLAFLDDGAVVAGQQWSIELAFQGTTGLSQVRVFLGWSEESLAVESPSGLAVQRLARTPGWHRFSLRFGPTQTEASVDGKELAHGKGPDGPLVAVRLVSSATAQAGAPKGLAGHFDDLQLIRFGESPASLELDITQDEARLVVGDELYGNIRQADGERLNMTVDGEPISLPWSDVAGLYFRRLPAKGTPIEGLLVRVEWRSSPDNDPENIDFAEGAVTAVSDHAVTLATPYAGVLAIPLELVRKLVVQGHGLRLVIDPAGHHLGDEYSETKPLDPPQPEGGLLERTLELASVPDRPCFVVLDLVQVVGENSDPAFSQAIRNGELRTYLAINGKRIDYLNRYIKSDNAAPERVAIPVPAGLLRTGKNSIRLELTGMAANEKQLDDFGLLQMAVEFRSAPNRVPQPPHDRPGPP